MNDKSEIAEITTTLLQGKIIEALKSRDDYIDELVKAVTTNPVNPDTGRSDGYSSSGKIPYLEYLCRSAIEDEIRVILRDELSQAADDMREKVRQILKTDGVVDGFTDAVLKSIQQDWNIKVVVSLPSRT